MCVFVLTEQAFNDGKPVSIYLSIRSYCWVTIFFVFCFCQGILIQPHTKLTILARSLKSSSRITITTTNRRKTTTILHNLQNNLQLLASLLGYPLVRLLTSLQATILSPTLLSRIPKNIFSRQTILYQPVTIQIPSK